MGLSELVSADVCQAIDLHGTLLEPQVAHLTSHIADEDGQPGLQVLGCEALAIVGSPGSKDGCGVALQPCNAYYEGKNDGGVQVNPGPL